MLRGAEGAGFSSSDPGDVRIALHRRAGKAIATGTPARVLAIIGHSAAGKSALLEQIGADRNDRDMDVFCYRHGLASTLETMLAMAARLTAPRVIVCSNESQFLCDLQDNQDDERLCDVLFCYIRRPQALLYDHLGLVNTDGCRRRYVSEADHALSYRAFDARYRALADIEVGYAGASIPSMSAAVQSLLGRLTR